MSDYSTYIDQFDQYLEGMLDKDAQKGLESAMKNDPGLARAFQEHKLLLDGIRYAARINLKENLSGYDKQLPVPMIPADEQDAGKKFSWYYVAAAVVFLVVSSVVLYNYNLTSYERLADNYYEAYDHVGSTSRGGEHSQVLESINYLHEQGKYSELLQAVAKLPEKDRSDEVTFLQAHAMLANDEYDSAIAKFKYVSDNSQNYKSAAMWYLSLAYLHVDQADAAIELLKELSEQKSSAHSSDAQALLNDLK